MFLSIALLIFSVIKSVFSIKILASNTQFLPGDIIQDFEEPFVKYLNEEYRGQHCYSCFLSKPMLKRCAGCKTVYYCNSNCQEADWKNSHSIECNLFSKSNVLSILDGDGVFQIIKLLAYLKKHGAKAKRSYTLYNGKKRCFDDLQDHYSGISSIQTYRYTSKKLATTLTDTNLFTLAESSYENVVHLYGIWRTNGFGINNEENTKSIGSAIYISASAFDHSCRPNTVGVTDASYRMQVRCIDAISVGEAPKMTYLAGMRPRNLRQEILSSRFYFICDCVLCEMERDAPAVDYDDLNRRRTELFEKMVFTADDFQRAMDVIQDMRKMFYKYDERITNFSHSTLEKLVAMLQGSSGCEITTSNVKEFAEQVEENLRNTYGTDYIDYKYFIEHLQPILRAFLKRKTHHRL